MIYIYTLKHISREAAENICSGFHHFTQSQEDIATVALDVDCSLLCQYYVMYLFVFDSPGRAKLLSNN